MFFIQGHARRWLGLVSLLSTPSLVVGVGRGGVVDWTDIQLMSTLLYIQPERCKTQSKAPEQEQECDLVWGRVILKGCAE